MNTPELELEQRLENIFSAGLEMLRGGWDVQQATQILLALFFNKRLLALVAEKKIDFLTLSAPNALLWENLKHESMPDPARTLCLFEEVLLELIQQNRALSHIFRPLLEALKTQALSDYLWQTIQHLQAADFSSKQFSVEIFGRFFTQSLYRSALKSGKTGADISTPVFINKLLVALSQPKRGELIYDPCVGQGNTFIEFYRSSSRLQFIGQELDFNVWAIAQMNLWANGVYDADILCQNSLFETPYDFPPADIAVGHKTTLYRHSFRGKQYPKFGRQRAFYPKNALPTARKR
jgi:type I restriction-modification system DNA methylase subunit